MANENIQGPVQLAGPGFVHRVNDDYQPGEYKELTNIDITNEGTLVNRPPVKGYMHPVVTNVSRFIGSYGSYAICTGSNGLMQPNVTYAINTHADTLSTALLATLVAELDTATAAIAGVRSDKDVTFEAAFVYNDRSYLLVYYTFNIAATNTKYGFLVPVQGTSPIKSFAFIQDSLDQYTFAGSIFAQDTLDITNDSDYTTEQIIPEFKVKNWTLHKERLWVATRDTVYFSAATVPDNFVPPSGGFFKFTGMNIKKIVPVGDLLYVFGDSSIKVIQYTTDPNLDAQVSIVSEVIGAEDATLLGDTIYCIKPGSLYEVRGLNVTKVMDLLLSLESTENLYYTGSNDWVTPYSFDLRLVAFNEALYVIPRRVRFFNAANLAQFSKYKCYYDEYVEEFPDASAYRINMNNGSTSRYRFELNGSPLDAWATTTEDKLNQTKLVFTGVGNKIFSLGTRARFYYGASESDIEYTIESYFIDSVSWNSGLGFYYTIPRYALHFRHFSPDNLKYLVKKFRTLSLEGNLPTYWSETFNAFKPLLWLTVKAGWNAESTILSTSLDPTDDTNSFINGTYRYGVNQRTKYIDIIIEAIPYGPLDGGGFVWYQSGILTVDAAEEIKAPAFEITDMRTTWSYLARGVTGKDDIS